MDKLLKLIGFMLIASVLICAPALANDGYFDQALVHYSQGKYQLALQEFQQAAKGGEAGAAYMLMKMHSEGYGEQPVAAAFIWAQKAAENGIAQAQYRLAQMYSQGKGTAVDHQQAYHWYQQAALQYHPLAMQQLARYYETGLGVKKNPAEAAHWYAIAASELDVFAQKGDAASQNRLAGLYEQGKGVKINLAAAMKWYRKAALQGLADAQFNLGRLLAYGEIENNPAEAVFWLQRAAQSGHDAASAMLARLAETTSGVASIK